MVRQLEQNYRSIFQESLKCANTEEIKIDLQVKSHVKIVRFLGR